MRGYSESVRPSHDIAALSLCRSAILGVNPKPRQGTHQGIVIDDVQSIHRRLPSEGGRQGQLTSQDCAADSTATSSTHP